MKGPRIDNDYSVLCYGIRTYELFLTGNTRTDQMNLCHINEDVNVIIKSIIKTSSIKSYTRILFILIKKLNNVEKMNK